MPETTALVGRSFLVGARRGRTWRPGRILILPGVAPVEAWGFVEEFSASTVRLFTARLFVPWSNVYLRLGTAGEDIQVTVSVPLWMRAPLRKALQSAGFTTIDRAVWLPWATRNE